MSKWQNGLLTALAASTALLGAMPVWAQAGGPDEAAAPSGGGLAEIVVTARRREESLSRVPASISALSADALTQRSVSSESELQTAVAGLTVRATAGGNMLNYAIRGQSVDAYSSSPAGVLTYFNEVPIASYTSTSFYDLENVQVLKGPQGTLFGRNSTGGAVLYQTARPRSEFAGYLSARYESYNRFIGEGMINVPIAEDRAILRLAGTYAHGGAYVRNLYDGKRYGDRNVVSGRATLLLTPVDGLTNTTMVQIGKFTGDNAANDPYDIIPCGATGGFYSCAWAPGVPAFATFLATHPRAFAGGLPGLEAYIRSQGKWVGYSDSPLDHKAKSTTISNKTEIELSDNLTLKNIFGYSFARSDEQFDYDATPYPFNLNGGVAGVPPYGVTQSKQVSEELQLQGKAMDGRLDYIVGGFYSRERVINDSPIQGSFIVPPSTIGGFALRYNQGVVNRSMAVFGQVSYALTDQLNLTVGGRYSWDKISSEQLTGSVFLGAADQSVKLDKPSWTATIDYRVTPELMLYATTRGSWRAGGYNTYAPPIGNTTAAGGGNYFLPETAKDVEVGVKYNGRLGDIPVRLNLAGYNSWIDSVQRTIYILINGNVASLTGNIPKAKVTGAEGDIELQPARWLTLGGSFSYNNGRFTDPKITAFGQTLTFGPYGDTPRFSGTLYGSVKVPLPDNAGEVTARADLYHQSKFYFSNLAATLLPGTVIPEYSLVNLRLDWSHVFGSRVSVGAYVRNVANKRYYIGGLPAGLNLAVNAAIYGQARTVGGSLRVDF